jgi:hypothetical protein
MTVVVADNLERKLFVFTTYYTVHRNADGYFVVLQIPAFHLPIFTSTEKVWVSRADLKGTNGADMAC